MAERRAGYLQGVDNYYDTLQSRPDLVSKAAKLVREKHAGQTRKESGLPYENHLWDCHRILTQELGIEDEVMEAAVLLHDVVEDGHATLEEIRDDFGDEVADLVGRLEKVITPEGLRDDMGSVQKVVSLENGNGGDIYNQQEAESMFVKALALKLVDRLSNMRDLPIEDAKERKATETLEVYVELAEALGMWEVKKELEDLAYADLHPAEYHRIKDAVENDPRRSKEFQDLWVEKLEMLAEQNDVEARVEVREASIRHIRDKHKRKAYKGEAVRGRYGEVNDVTSFRLKVNDTNDIYPLLGKIMDDPYLGGLVKRETIDHYTGPESDLMDIKLFRSHWISRKESWRSQL
jgi:GTP diphosphokinase / guanosine-3',5'-bis(diphosphate) 3'-diphosphatase